LNNSIVDGLESEAINSLDATYVFCSPKLKSRITLTIHKKGESTAFIMLKEYLIMVQVSPNTNGFVSQTLTKIEKTLELS
jgi:hypothetical protein